jgi:diguanylate cyclase (GGDEF)-like protein
MDGLMIGAGVVVILVGVFFWMYRKEKKKIHILERDLNFFKKEKEYYHEAMMVLDGQNNIIFANAATKKLFSLDDANRILPDAKKIALKIDSKDPRDFFEVLAEQAALHKGSFHLQNVLLVVAGKMKQVNIYVDRSDFNDTMTCVVDMQTVVPEKSKSAVKEGGVDFLTSLPSQFVALSEINTQVMKSQKNSESFALLLLGIDHFSDLQATLGLGFTNQLLKRIANYFIENPVEHIQVFRMDCDKFLLIIDSVTDMEDARQIAKKLVSDIGNLQKEESSARITASVGIVIYPEHGENPTKLINHMYSALREAQSESDSNVEVFSLEYQMMHKEEAKINEEIKKGLKAHEFFLYYQPIFNLETEEMVGAEALLRWKHPELGVIPADKFLGIAEKTGLIVDIGEYVFREAIKQRKFWDDNGLKKFKITLNLSLKEMQVEKLIQKIESLFEDHHVDPREFNLDITEKAAMANIEKTMMDFKLFRELGLSISLDNFGAGSSSIKHLQLLPLSTIKIDRSLIFDLYSNLDHQITVKAMVDMIHDLGFEAVAEGVETSKESALLYDIGCDHAQGYLFSKPLPAAELQDLLK